MAEHRIAILNRIAVADAGIELVCNNPTDTIRFEFDKEWSGITAKTARFSWDGKYIDVPFSGNAVKVPEIFQTHYVYVGVFAKNITSTPAKVKCRYSIKCLGGKNAPPSNDVYAQIMELLNADLTNSKAVEGRVSSLENYEKRPYEVIGNPVQFENYEGMPLDVVAELSPKQAGSGEPSPDNIRPIAGYDVLRLAAVGANLAPTHSGFTGESGLTYSVSDGKITITGTATKNVRLDTDNFILPPGQYTLAPNNSVPASIALYMRKPDGTQFGSINLASSTTAKHTFTLAEPTEACVSLYIGSGAVLDVTVAIMLNVGTVKAFEPYNGNIYTVQIGQTIYGGKIDWNTGKLIADRALRTIDGSEAWTASNTNTSGKSRFFAAGIAPGILPPPDTSTVAEGLMCSHYKASPSTAGGPYQCVQSVGIYTSGAVYFYDDQYAAKTADEWKSYVAAQYAAGTPIQVAYKLANPIEIQFTPHEILALHGVNTFYGDGEIKVSGRKDILWLTSSLIERIKTLEEAVVSLGGNV